MTCFCCLAAAEARIDAATVMRAYQIILKKRSAGPTVGKPPEMTFHLFFMASYDLDRFRRAVILCLSYQ